MKFIQLRAASIAVISALAAVSPAARAAQAGDFAAGSRVEGRIGSVWDSCTTLGERRPAGGYTLRCDSIPNQESVFAASDVRAMQGLDRGAAKLARPVPRPAAAPAMPATHTDAAAADAQAKASPPRPGVYGCMNQDTLEMLGLQFGLIDAVNYSTYEGGRGRYAYSAVSGTLTFTSGPFAGLKRTRETEKTFRIIDAGGARTAFLCPWTSKDPQKKHW